MADLSQLKSAIAQVIRANGQNAITGTALQQKLLDLVDGLNEAKQDSLVSGTNVKTINNQSILGSGNIDIQGGDASKAVQYVPQELTEAQQMQARKNQGLYYKKVIESDTITFDPEGDRLLATATIPSEELQGDALLLRQTQNAIAGQDIVGCTVYYTDDEELSFVIGASDIITGTNCYAIFTIIPGILILSILEAGEFFVQLPYLEISGEAESPGIYVAPEFGKYNSKVESEDPIFEVIERNSLKISDSAFIVDFYVSETDINSPGSTQLFCNTSPSAVYKERYENNRQVIGLLHIRTNSGEVPVPLSLEYIGQDEVDFRVERGAVAEVGFYAYVGLDVHGQANLYISVLHPVTRNELPQDGFESGIYYHLGLINNDTIFSIKSDPFGGGEEFFWTFDTPATVPQITFPSGIEWAGGSAPTLSASKHYEVTILKGYATILEFNIIA